MHRKNWIVGGLLIVANLLIGMFVFAQTDPYPLPGTLNLRDGYELVEGDMVLPIEVARGRATYDAASWTDGVIPYQFASYISTTNRNLMRAAMDEWESVAWLTFVPRTTQSNYINIIEAGGNWSYVGMVGGGQDLSMYNWSYKYIIEHELAHALGFWHEQSRPDRDNYVSIQWQNIPDNVEHNFQIHSDAGTVGSYDFASVMHYDAYAFSSNGQPTIVAQPGYEAYQDSMGNLSYLTDSDKAGMAYLYPEVTVLAGDTAATAFIVDPSGYSLSVASAPYGESADEPLPTLCVGTANVTDTIWFKVPSSVTVRNLVLSSSGYDTVMAVYSGSPESMALEACVDSYASSGTEIIDIVLEPTYDYYLQVGGWSGSSGTLDLNAALFRSLISNGSFDWGVTLPWTVNSVPTTRKDDRVRFASGIGMNYSWGMTQFKGGSGENSIIKQVRTSATIAGGWTFLAGDEYLYGGYVQSSSAKNNLVLRLTVKYANGTKTVSKFSTFGVLSAWTWRAGVLTLTRSDVVSMTLAMNNKSLGGLTKLDNMVVLLYDSARADSLRSGRPAPDKQAPTLTTREGVMPLPAVPGGFRGGN